MNYAVRYGSFFGFRPWQDQIKGVKIKGVRVNLNFEQILIKINGALTLKSRHCLVSSHYGYHLHRHPK
jgi:hypothetical protein